MPKAKVEHDIDLQCSLCPKNPTFSDISHLLTHISSKSHLSHRFKLQIIAQNDETAKETLEGFDFWYHQNNLDTLLSERLAAKNIKKSSKERKSRTSGIAIKKEQRRSASVSAREAPLLNGIPVFRAPVPQMHLWPTIPAIAAEENNHKQAVDNEWEASGYATPTARRHVPNYTRAESPSSLHLDPSLSISWKSPDHSSPNKEEDKKSPLDKSSDSTTLKGVVWPGMALFDSATPEMKRMRNQKKDKNVMEQMIATSLEVEPAEISYHANGEFRGSRYLFGPLSTENSPERAHVSPVRKRKSRRVPALGGLSTNAPRLRAPRGRKPAAAGQSPTKRPAAMHAQLPVLLQRPSSLNPLAMGMARPFVPTAEEEEEFRMTVGDMSKKRNFSVFQDAPEISPGRTESPLEEHRFDDFPHHGLPMFPNNMNNMMGSAPFHISPTPTARQVSFRNFGKENGQPEIATPSQARQGPFASHVYPPQLWRDPFTNPLQTYNQSYFSQSMGYSHMAMGDLRSPNRADSFLSDFQIRNPIARTTHQPGAIASSSATTDANKMHHAM